MLMNPKNILFAVSKKASLSQAMRLVKKRKQEALAEGFHRILMSQTHEQGEQLDHTQYYYFVLWNARNY